MSEANGTLGEIPKCESVPEGDELKTRHCSPSGSVQYIYFDLGFRPLAYTLGFIICRLQRRYPYG